MGCHSGQSDGRKDGSWFHAGTLLRWIAPGKPCLVAMSGTVATVSDEVSLRTTRRSRCQSHHPTLRSLRESHSPQRRTTTGPNGFRSAVGSKWQRFDFRKNRGALGLGAKQTESVLRVHFAEKTFGPVKALFLSVEGVQEEVRKWLPKGSSVEPSSRPCRDTTPTDFSLVCQRRRWHALP